MASQPPANLPLFYQNLVPLQSGVHGSYRTRSLEKLPFLASTHAVPITVDEFIFVQRNYPIVFSVGDNPVPLALFGLNDGVNAFIDEDGKVTENVYIPAYIRRYPFMLAKLRPESDELSLCFDPTSGMIGEFEDGNPLIDGEKPTDHTNEILKFCEEFELSAQRTNAFLRELKDMDLIMDGEVAIQVNPGDQPYVYRGFQMVDEAKFRELRGDTLRKINQNGILPLIMAHLFSLSLTRDVFGRQLQQGRIPPLPSQQAVN